YIDTFLLSCRVIGRGIESALLAYIAAETSKRGAARLLGQYIPSARNQLAADFYLRHGFTPLPDAPPDLAQDGAITYEFDLRAALPEKPSWIPLEDSLHATANA